MIVCRGCWAQIRPGLQALYPALAAADRPATVKAWLNKSAPAIVRELAGKELTHRALDELPAGKTVEHLRSVLVAIGTLPERDEQMSRLERWTAWVIAECPDPGQQQLLHRYAVWHVTRRLRARLGGSHATHNQVVAAQRHIKAAVAYMRCRIPALPSAQRAATASMAALRAAARDQHSIGHVDH